MGGGHRPAPGPHRLARGDGGDRPGGGRAPQHGAVGARRAARRGRRRGPGAPGAARLRPGGPPRGLVDAPAGRTGGGLVRRRAPRAAAVVEGPRLRGPGAPSPGGEALGRGAARGLGRRETRPSSSTRPPTRPSTPTSSGGPGSTCSSAARWGPSRWTRAERPGKVHLSRRPAIVIEEDGQRLSATARSGFMFVALPEKTNWTTGERSAFDGMPLAFQYDPRALVRRLSPIQLPRDASGRSVPDLLIYAMGILGTRVHGDVRRWRSCWASSSPARSRGASTRSRWGRRSSGRATSTTRSASARATSSGSWRSPST